MRHGLRIAVSAAAGMAIISLLAAAGWGFVLKSLPYQTPQIRPPRVTLTSLDTAQFAHYPVGVPAVPALAWRDVSNRPGNLVTTPARFAETLATMRRDGFHSVRLAALEALAKGKRVRLPARPVVLTFDGGLATDWTTVDPILKQYGFTAVVFVNPSDVATKSPSYFLTRDEVHAMAASGRWDIGAQIPIERRLQVAPRPGGPGAAGAAYGGAPGPESVTEWRERAAKDAAAAEGKLQGIIGRPVDAYGWPASQSPTANTRKAPAVLYAALRHYFPLVFSRPGTGSAAFAVRGSARLPLPRVRVTAADSLPTLSARLRAGIPGPPPADPLTLAWRAAGGKCHTTRHTVRLTARRFALCTPVANGYRWSGYALHLRLAAPADVTAIIEVGVSKAGRIEIAIGRSGLRIEQETGSHWKLLRTVASVLPPVLDGNTSPLLGGGVQPVTVSLAGRMLSIGVGSVAVQQQISLKGPAAGHGLIAVGLAAATKPRSVRFSRLYLTHASPPAAHHSPPAGASPVSGSPASSPPGSGQ